jgi:hypothetical protein
MTRKSSSKPALEALYVEVRRLDELSLSEKERVNGLFNAQETAVNAALVAQEKAVAAALAASEKAVNKAEAAQGNVNETQNEFRGSLKDQATTQMPRAEAEVTFRELRGLIAAQGEIITGLRSRLDVGPPSLAAIQARSDNDAGRRSSSTQGWVFVGMAFSILFGVAGLAFAFLTALSR